MLATQFEKIAVLTLDRLCSILLTRSVTPTGSPGLPAADRDARSSQVVGRSSMHMRQQTQVRVLIPTYREPLEV
jgi:hypothetical protein